MLARIDDRCHGCCPSALLYPPCSCGSCFPCCFPFEFPLPFLLDLLVDLGRGVLGGSCQLRQFEELDGAELKDHDHELPHTWQYSARKLFLRPHSHVHGAVLILRRGGVFVWCCSKVSYARLCLRFGQMFLGSSFKSRLARCLDRLFRRCQVGEGGCCLVVATVHQDCRKGHKKIHGGWKVVREVQALLHQFQA